MIKKMRFSYVNLDFIQSQAISGSIDSIVFRPDKRDMLVFGKDLEVIYL